MKNADMPASPTYNPLGTDTTGLSKREYFALFIISGIASANDMFMPELSAKQAVQAADALLEELSK